MKYSISLTRQPVMVISSPVTHNNSISKVTVCITGKMKMKHTSKNNALLMKSLTKNISKKSHLFVLTAQWLDEHCGQNLPNRDLPFSWEFREKAEDCKWVGRMQ
jgi:hypothetical protein